MDASDLQPATMPTAPIWAGSGLRESQLKRLAQQFAGAEPFPHLVIDGLFDSSFLLRIAEEFAAVRADGWEWYDNPRERKLGTRAGRPLPPCAQAYFNAIYAGSFLRKLSAITGIDDLIVDPMLFGGGMHAMPPGGRFDLHTDFQQHPRTRLNNRLVLITYLNSDWREEYGGVLELWDEDCRACRVRITPDLGRTVLMLQSPTSAHGVTPVTSATRRSLAAYFYTNDPARAGAPPTATTTFLRRYAGDEAKWLLKRLAPPILVDALRAITGRPVRW